MKASSDSNGTSPEVNRFVPIYLISKMSCPSMLQAFSQVYTNTRKLLLRIGRIPKNAENDDRLSKFPGIDYDLSE